MNLERKFPIADTKQWNNPRIDTGYVCSFVSEGGHKYGLHVIDWGMCEPSWIIVESDTDWQSGPMSALLELIRKSDIHAYCVQCLCHFGMFSWRPNEVQC